MKTGAEIIGFILAAGVLLFLVFIILGVLLAQHAFDSLRHIEPGPHV